MISSTLASRLNLAVILFAWSSAKLGSVEGLFQGEKSYLGQFPWMVRLDFCINSTNKIDCICGGAIIHEKWILTAGHCLFLRNKLNPDKVFTKKDLFVVTNKTKIETEGNLKWHPINSVIRHPKFKSDMIDTCYYNTDDIGLIYLDEPLKLDGKYVDKIKLANRFDLRPGEMMRVSGFGETGSGKSEGLEWIDLDVAPFDRCNKNYQDVLVKEQFCGRFRESQRSLSRGDDGSPVVVDNHLVAVASFICMILESHSIYFKPSIFTNVIYYYQWIKEQLAQHGHELLPP